MKSILTLLSLFIFLSLGAITAPKELQKPMQIILAHRESADFIHSLEQEGGIRVLYSSFPKQKITALWEANSRTIYINKDRPYSESDIIRSIIFELHNAASSKQLEAIYDKAYRGQISKENFVRSIEFMEHKNALMAQQLIENGIRAGKFSKGCTLHCFANFDDYYALQQLFEHSHWIAARYDEVSPLKKTAYMGTIGSLPLSEKKNRIALLNYLGLKNDPIYTETQKRLTWLSQEYEQAGEVEKELLQFIFQADLQEHPFTLCQSTCVSSHEILADSSAL